MILDKLLNDFRRNNKICAYYEINGNSETCSLLKLNYGKVVHKQSYLKGIHNDITAYHVTEEILCEYHFNVIDSMLNFIWKEYNDKGEFELVLFEHSVVEEELTALAEIESVKEIG